MAKVMKCKKKKEREVIIIFLEIEREVIIIFLEKEREVIIIFQEKEIIIIFQGKVQICPSMMEKKTLSHRFHVDEAL